LNLQEGVGKSSLISTFVSRHFSEVVPGIMTRVRLPPDPENSCITTIVDSQGGDAALMSAVATMSMAGIGGGGTGAGGGFVIEGIGPRHHSGGAPHTIPQSASTPGVAGGGTGGGGVTGNSSSNNNNNLGVGGTNSSGDHTSPLLRSFAPSVATTSLGGIENVDSIILIYDLDRDETFFRLENHWLPLIERCYNGGVSLEQKHLSVTIIQRRLLVLYS
jgi:hypothetical protein